MSKIILDDAIRAKLDDRNGHAELYDASGERIGPFLTHDQYTRLMYAWAKSQFTDEEAERAWSDYLQNGGVSTEEAWRRVKNKMSAREGAA
jgi:hypothetical protein